MFDVVIHCGHYSSGRVFNALPRIGDEMQITFAENMISLWNCKVVKVSWQELEAPNKYDGNSNKPFIPHIYLEEPQNI